MENNQINHVSELEFTTNCKYIMYRLLILLTPIL